MLHDSVHSQNQIKSAGCSDHPCMELLSQQDIQYNSIYSLYMSHYLPMYTICDHVSNYCTHGWSGKSSRGPERCQWQFLLEAIASRLEAIAHRGLDIFLIKFPTTPGESMPAPSPSIYCRMPVFSKPSTGPQVG